MLVLCVSHIGLKIPLLFNAFIHTQKVLRLGVKVSNVTKEYDIIGGMSFANQKLSIDWIVVLLIPCFHITNHG